jgi:methyl-accepting chemotaxis protein/methyl-accepting chemotaxis protein-1 (serine sensor receptor)
MKFAELKIATRLAILIAFVCSMMAVVGITGLMGMQDTNQAIESMYKDRVIPLKQLKIVADEYAVNVVDTAHKVRDSALTPQQGLENLAKARKLINAEWNAYIATTLVQREKDLVQEFKKLQGAADASLKTLEGHLKSGDIAALTNYAAKEMYPAIDPISGVVANLIQTQLDVSDELVKEAVADYKFHVSLAMSLSVVGVLGAALLGWLITRSITGQLGAEPHESSAVASHVAGGDLSTTIALKSGDNSSMMAQLKGMQDNLISIVGNVFTSAENVATASAQIAQGNNDLAARTESQAGALEQTAAAIEQLSSTVKQNADNARQANQLAQSATTVASQGGEVVADVVRTMKDINDSSTKISDIIGVIDSIAFQTNILALNAAVEAARAGEQGRGFAVVASEVRSLAGRSAEAAREIKSLISASVERVEAGSALVDRAGQTMTEVVTSIRRVTDLMGEISSASNEQSLGVSQIHEAITHLDQATQQNAALVEEMSAAASSLNSQAEGLVNTVSVFKLPGGTANRQQRRAAPAPAPKPVAKTVVKGVTTGRVGSNKTSAPAPARQLASAPATPTAKAPATATKSAGGEDEWESF